MTPKKAPLTIYQGATFEWPFYWYSDVETVVAISAVSLSYPATLTTAAHGLPTSPVPVTLIGVPDWLKSASLLVGDRVYATKTDTTHCTVKIDGTDQDAYDGVGGLLIYNTPMDLSVGWTARMQIRESLDDTVILAEFLDSDGTIVLGADGKILLTMLDADTDLLDFSVAVYDLELQETISGEVTRVATGKVTLVKQVTR